MSAPATAWGSRLLVILAVVGGTAGAGVALGHRLDPTFGSQGSDWRSFCEPSGGPVVLGAAVPPFRGVDQAGRIVTEREFQGLPWISDFIFTRCQGLCPTLTARLVALQRRLPDSDVRFVSFSVDPEHDDPPALRAYEAHWHGDSRRWRLISTDRATLRRLAAAFGGPPEPDPAAQGGLPHSDRFTLVDRGGRIRSFYSFPDSGDWERLRADVGSLALSPHSP